MNTHKVLRPVFGEQLAKSYSINVVIMIIYSTVAYFQAHHRLSLGQIF